MENSADKVVQIGRARLVKDRGIILLDTPDGGEEELDLSGYLPPADIPVWKRESLLARIQQLSEEAYWPSVCGDFIAIIETMLDHGCCELKN